MAHLERPQLWRTVLWIILGLVVLWFVTRIYYTIFIFALAMLIAYLLNPIMNALSGIRFPFLKRALSRNACIAIVYVLLVVLATTVGIIAVPLVVEQVKNAIEDVPQSVDKIQSTVQYFQGRYRALKLPPQIEEHLREALPEALQRIGSVLSIVFQQMGNALVTVFSSLFFIITALIISVFILINWEDLGRRFLGYFPPPYRGEVKHLLGEMNSLFGGFLRSMIILCSINGILTFTFLILLSLLCFFVPGWQHYRYSLIVSFIAGVTYAVPIVGIVLSAFIGAALAYLQYQNFVYVAVITLIIVGVNNMVDRFICPKVMSETMGVSPLFIIFAAFAGGELLGVWGMLLGVPLAAMIKTLLRYIHHRFLDVSELPGSLAVCASTIEEGKASATIEDSAKRE